MKNSCIVRRKILSSFMLGDCAVYYGRGVGVVVGEEEKVLEATFVDICSPARKIRSQEFELMIQIQARFVL